MCVDLHNGGQLQCVFPEPTRELEFPSWLRKWLALVLFSPDSQALIVRFSCLLVFAVITLRKYKIVHVVTRFLLVT